MSPETARENRSALPAGAYSDKVYQAIAETFRALADPTRARVVHALTKGERTVNSLADELGVSGSAISHQLRTLRQMGLVRFRRDGPFARYSLDDPHIERLMAEAHRHVSDDTRNR